MSSAFAQLPAAVLSDILWLIPFFDTLRCEQVCRSWRKVLKRSAAASEDVYPTWSPGIWGGELHLTVVKTDKEWDEPALKLAQVDESRSISITVLVSKRHSTYFCEVFFTWLTEHAAGFLNVFVSVSVSVYKGDPESSWVFARTILAVGIASLSAPREFSVCFDAGELYFDCKTHWPCIASHGYLTAADMFTLFALSCCNFSELTRACISCRLGGDPVAQLL